MEKLKKIPKNVYLLSFVSFFNDIASEMLYPIMPIFIVQILGAPVYVIGIIDGFAEGISSFLKTYFGHLSDKFQTRKPFVVAGYSLSAFSKFIIALAHSWPVVFIGRLLDRLGKGVRTAARDALLLGSTSKNNRGFIFGLHRSFDSAGAVIGPAIALILLKLFPNNIRLILYTAVIPSLLGLLLFVFIKDPRGKKIEEEKQKLSFKVKQFSPKFRIILLTLGIFSLGNSTDSFLILRSKHLGLSLVAIILIYMFYNLIYTLLSTPAGIVADRLGARKVFLLGLLFYTIVYVGFALNKNANYVWLLFAIYGAFIALTDGVSKALIGSCVAKEESATAYGITQTVMSIGTLLASLIGGFLWSAVSSTATFLFGAICSALALMVFFFYPSDGPLKKYS